MQFAHSLPYKMAKHCNAECPSHTHTYTVGGFSSDSEVVIDMTPPHSLGQNRKAGFD